jgi:hypothetical protein
MTRKEKLKEFIAKSESLNSLNLLFDMYNIDILYDNELSRLFFLRKKQIKAQEIKTWHISYLN